MFEQHKTNSKDLTSQLKHYRLSQAEYERMREALGHEPNTIEWAVFSALWSEHCSYKSSRVHLKKLFTKHQRVVQGPGENAGVIDLGCGERVAFKMESHNHPSFIEPTQGAATGVGGILRDIFTMGARPIASMDYLCFGEGENELVPKLLQGVVKGVGGYGNCVGVATVNGQTTFHKSYNTNNLVNAFSLGLFRPNENIFYGRAEGPGNLVVYVGARTGRDGVHGAAMASESFDSDNEKKKPNVQIGDPFFEKLLIEACIEVMKENLVVGIQDMGAAGLTSSTFEMASRAQCGLKLDLKKVPLREPDITPEEILLSESQERMVLVVEPSKYKRVEEIFAHWGLSCSTLGEITSGDLVELYWGHEKLGSISHRPLVDSAPVYERPFDLPAAPARSAIDVKEPKNFSATLLEFLSSTSMTSREWITKQYDQRVGARTIVGCEDGVAQIRLPDSGRVVTMATGCRPLLMEWHVAEGAKDAVVLPVLQMAAKGATALACTDCLNFGNPEKKNVMGQFVSALHALDSACRAFDVPIISGNVSLYNETLGENIVPTPSTGIVGLRAELLGPAGHFKETGLKLYTVANRGETFWLGEYASVIAKVPTQGEVDIQFDTLVELQKAYLELAKISESSRVITRGGLLATLAKMSTGDVGVDIELSALRANFARASKIQSVASAPSSDTLPSTLALLFAERFYAAVWAVKAEKIVEFEAICKRHQVTSEKIGETASDTFKVGSLISLKVEEIKKAYNKGLRGIVEKLA